MFLRIAKWWRFRNADGTPNSCMGFMHGHRRAGPRFSVHWEGEGGIDSRAWGKPFLKNRKNYVFFAENTENPANAEKMVLEYKKKPKNYFCRGNSKADEKNENQRLP